MTLLYFLDKITELYPGHVQYISSELGKTNFRNQGVPSEKTLGTLAKILHILTYSRLLLKLLIRSCLFLLHTNLLNFLIVFLVRVLSRVSRSCKTNINFVYKYFVVVRTTATLSFFEVLNIGQHKVVNFRT